MKTTTDYLDSVKLKLGLPSDYALAKYWAVSKQHISEYRNGKRTLGDERALEVARILGINPVEVFIAIQCQRAKSDQVKQVWGEFMEKISMGFKDFISHGNPRRRYFSAR